ncbi:C40 family peptidase [Lacibacter sediminis]|uniref:C40 family peptidase n=1 Tax=Lacibacter sediminis TaxID=2760713 RepID=A0A7G5XLQ0_9BACT|nr:NlpC/P60 family protein [Lacibacter sediminis]QNA46403.1 C40 family peptidase [Lacibacter sediminis]
MNSVDTVVTPTPEKVTDDAQTNFVDSFSSNNVQNDFVDTGNEVSPGQLLAYAKTLIGTPHKYASVDPAEGLDCSGFITHVFNHFSINVPRSSIDFTNYGTTVNLADAETGDLILFTGTDTLSEVVGHMGIITEIVDGELQFIHSTSGKAYAVTISKLNPHYKKRFVKVIRISYALTGKLEGLEIF